MRFHRAFAGGLTALSVTLAARSAATQPEPARVAVTFTDSAASLPQNDIRAAVARELEHRPDDGSSLAGELNISVENQLIVVRFRGTQGYTERVLPLPEERAQIPLMIALLAGNVARDQRAVVRPEPVVPSVVVPPPPARHYLGLHLAQDFMFVGGQNVCDPNLGQASSNYACFHAGTSNPFFNTPSPSSDSISSTLVAATTRVLASYDFAFTPHFTLGLRAGFAFRGGPPAGQVPGDLQSGTSFFPWHVELRASYWFVPLTHRTWGGFVGVGAGLAQIDAKAHHAVVDCQAVAEANTTPADPAGDAAFATCSQGTPVNGQTTTELDAWKKTGQAFVGVNGGALLRLSDKLGATLDLNVLFMTPATGVAFEPALGMVFTP